MTDPAELGVLAALAAGTTAPHSIVSAVADALDEGRARRAVESLLARRLVQLDAGGLSLSPAGAAALLDACAEIEHALDPSPAGADQTECPSVPWLTTVQTEWIEAVSLNYAVAPAALAELIPAPLEPEVFEGSAWVQLLVSSLRDLRPQGLTALFGVNFYQASYRAAVRYRAADGSVRRGGYFVRTETNNTVMRAVGNRLTEFKFHDFGAAQMGMVREGNTLTLGIEAENPGGNVVAHLDTSPGIGPPSGSVWRSLEHLREPLVECYDALGVDADASVVYILTIDRGAWNARFAAVREVYCEYFDGGPLQGARLDSVLHIPRCPYGWRPLRREPF